MIMVLTASIKSPNPALIAVKPMYTAIMPTDLKKRSRLRVKKVPVFP